MSLHVVVTDEQTGDTETVRVPDGDYFIVCTEPCYVAHINAHVNGAHVLTIKGRVDG